MRVLGVDPGSAVTGFGVVDGSGGGFRYVSAGAIRSAAHEPAPMRLKHIHDELLELIDEFRPEALSLERHFVAQNAQSAFRIGEARAVAMLAAAERGVPLFEYPPNEVKLSVAAYGHADKAQVRVMVLRTLNLHPASEFASDATDALALAICHAGRARAAAPAPMTDRRRSAAPRIRAR
jgi:crossover junction endodeoxyribonuclease RuvC